MRQTTQQLVPRARGRRVADTVRQVQAALLRGDAVTCPCCGRSFRRFLDYGQPRRRGVRCPGCGSLERHRSTWLYLTAIAHVLDEPCRVLDVAPAPFIGAALRRAPAVEYLSIDLESPLAMRRMDVTRLDLPDAAFDVVLCSHVLEHVPDDRAAMRELLRVLRPSGFAMLQTPWNAAKPTTDEDPHLLDVAERVRRFGQADHVRSYGRDLIDRLADTGWRIEMVSPAEAFGSDAVRRHGLDPDDPLIVGHRRD